MILAKFAAAHIPAWPGAMTVWTRWRAWISIGDGVAKANARRGLRPAWHRIRPGDPPRSADSLALEEQTRDEEMIAWMARQRQAIEALESQMPAQCDHRWADHPEWICPFIRRHQSGHIPYIQHPDGRLEGVPFEQVVSAASSSGPAEP